VPCLLMAAVLVAKAPTALALAAARCLASLAFLVQPVPAGTR
jgi:hypothetical protein